MDRMITEKLRLWKNNSRRKPLLLTGVRQCGKTTVIKQFGEAAFENTVYINFEENPNLADIFSFDFDVNRILKEIRAVTGKKTEIGKTLLILDEIQECPRAITSLKYFCENMRELHIIAAGSLLDVALKRENISFPVGKVNRLQMYPMSFFEFAKAAGGSGILDVISGWPTDRMIPPIYSVPMEKLLRDYFIVGGMPEAVSEWVAHNDYVIVEEIQGEILRDYADDFSKHAPVKEIEKIRWVWDSIPKQLSKKNNKFVFSHVKEGKRSTELEDALQWIVDAGLAYKLELVENPEIPLSSAANAAWFKVYLSDIGLLRKRSGLSYQTVLENHELYTRFKGAFAENYVMNELVVQEFQPYFWRSGNTAEIDFLAEKDNSIIPIEVKAADNTQAKSYGFFCKKYSPETGFKMSLKNIGENLTSRTRTVSLPLYMLWDMDRYLQPAVR